MQAGRKYRQKSIMKIQEKTKMDAENIGLPI